VLGAFTLLAGVQAGRTLLVLADRGQPGGWGEVLPRALVDWWGALPALPALLLLVHRFPAGPGRWARHGGLLLAGACLTALAQDALVTPLLQTAFGLPVQAPLRAGRLVGTAISHVLALGFLHAGVGALRLRAREAEAERLSRALAESQLASLRLQLQPHFLFNALNAVAALIPRDPRGADRMLTRLAQLLRAVLEHPPGHEHPLSAELALLEQYLDVMRVRFGPRLTVEREVDPALGEARVPWLLLQPLVENALEHGVSRAEGPARLRLTAARDGDALRLAVDDSGPGLAAAPGGEGPGIGLENTRRRLESLYGARGRLRLGPSPLGGVRVEVHLPLSAAGARPGVAA
jgi:hypothetical protein